MKILITGGAGFIGSNLARHMTNKYPQYEFIIFDKLTYAGNLDNLKDLENKNNYSFIQGDVCDLNLLVYILKDIDIVIHLAAESHVDNSLGNSLEFTKSNALGTHILLEAIRLSNVKKLIHISTDEVYGDIEEGSFKESDKLNPTNPYSASKAAAEMIVNGYKKTYNLPIIITRSNNTYGPFQYPEKIIPRFITNLFLNKKVPLHGKGDNTRTYVHVEDVCRAIDMIFQKGKIGETYNIGTDYEMSNLDLAKFLIKKLGKENSYIDHVQDRPFNDRRYSIDMSKLYNLGWKPEFEFEEGINKTIKWYEENKDWWLKILKCERIKDTHD